MTHNLRLLIVRLIVYILLVAILLLGMACEENPQHNINVDYNQLQGEVVGAGTYYEGETVTITAESEADYIFVSWTEGDTVISRKDSYSFIVNSNRNINANFIKKSSKYTIRIASAYYQGSATGDGEYKEGETVTVEAKPNSGFKFINWTVRGTELSNNSKYTFIIDKDYYLKANYESIKGYFNGNNNDINQKSNVCPYLGSRESHVFHKNECHYVNNILPQNLICFTSRENALNSNKRPCKVCKP